MTDAPMTEFDQLLGLHLDGELTPVQQARLDELVASDPELARRLRAAEEVESGLRRAFAPPPPQDLDDLISEQLARASAATKRQGILKPRSYALAAVLVLAVGAWTASLWVQRGRAVQAGPVYAALVNDFRPYSPCNTPESFASYTAKAFEKALALSLPPSNVELLGWRQPDPDVDPDDAMGSRSRMMLAYVDGDPVVVVMDLDDWKAPRVHESKGSPLRIFTRETDGYVMYEITPHDRPAIIDHIGEPSLPSD